MEQENFIFRFYGAVIQNDVAKYFSIKQAELRKKMLKMWLKLND